MLGEYFGIGITQALTIPPNSLLPLMHINSVQAANSLDGLRQELILARDVFKKIPSRLDFEHPNTVAFLRGLDKYVVDRENQSASVSDSTAQSEQSAESSTDDLAADLLDSDDIAEVEPQADSTSFFSANPPSLSNKIGNEEEKEDPQPGLLSSSSSIGEDVLEDFFADDSPEEEAQTDELPNFIEYGMDNPNWPLQLFINAFALMRFMSEQRVESETDKNADKIFTFEQWRDFSRQYAALPKIYPGIITVHGNTVNYKKDYPCAWQILCGLKIAAEAEYTESQNKIDYLIDTIGQTLKRIPEENRWFGKTAGNLIRINSVTGFARGLMRTLAEQSKPVVSAMLSDYIKNCDELLKQRDNTLQQKFSELNVGNDCTPEAFCNNIRAIPELQQLQDEDSHVISISDDISLEMYRILYSAGVQLNTLNSLASLLLLRQIYEQIRNDSVKGLCSALSLKNWTLEEIAAADFKLFTDFHLKYTSPLAVQRFISDVMVNTQLITTRTVVNEMATSREFIRGIQLLKRNLRSMQIRIGGNYAANNI